MFTILRNLLLHTTYYFWKYTSIRWWEERALCHFQSWALSVLILGRILLVWISLRVHWRFASCTSICSHVLGWWSSYSTAIMIQVEVSRWTLFLKEHRLSKLDVSKIWLRLLLWLCVSCWSSLLKNSFVGAWMLGSWAQFWLDSCLICWNRLSWTLNSDVWEPNTNASTRYSSHYLGAHWLKVLINSD